MVHYKTPSDIAAMKEGGRILAQILSSIASAAQPSVSAYALEHIARTEIKKAGAEPAFLNYDTKYMGKFPSALCVSVNDEVVHGIPSPDKIFHEGDIIGVDCGIWYKGLCVDSAITVPCGNISNKASRLIRVAKEALSIGISRCRAGHYIGDIGEGIQRYVESNGFCVIKSLVGHGVGREVHEDPQIPNFFPFDARRPKNRGIQIKEGMTLAIEPMISEHCEKTKQGTDGYAAVTSDGSLAAHFEHTVAVTKQGTIILTQ
ncbi:MAG: type I methionyl aminopeptidase [Candidatus Jacksonbacteria bacterium]|nr:type I methionyl aminopeptidase [Candidatus Jacksonbacteria bacterium]